MPKKQTPKDFTSRLMASIEARSATVGIIGLGYVGLPLALAFGKAGFPVIGFDVDPAKVKAINAGKSYIEHIPRAAIREFGRRRNCRATTDFAELKKADAILICVPTPLTHHREPDMRFIEETSETVARHLRAGQLVSLESTTYPGTSREVVLPRLASRGLKPGRDFFLAFSPEREDPGNPDFGTTAIPKVVGGLTPACRRLASALYSAVVVRTVPVSSCEAAEATKLLENIFRSINIALVNELKVLFERMGIDIWEVIEAARTKPFGYMPFYPGPGLGGHCIPIDPFYLTWKAREYELPTRFIELAGEINTAMPAYVVDRLVEALSEDRKAVKGARILVLGASYKANVDDIRESPSLKLIQLLEKKGAKVDYSDPHKKRLLPTREYDIRKNSVALTPKSVARYDAVLIATAHKAFDYALLGKHARLIVDTRNAMKAFGVKRSRARVVRA
ncbi:MAG: nucleotide sugar dehydrogenase [Planctomycetota bacterium]